MKLLKFSAQWCNPCKMLSSTLATCSIPVPIEEIDIDENQELTQKYGVRSIPTMILVDDTDEIVSVSIGQKTKDQINKWIESNV